MSFASVLSSFRSLRVIKIRPLFYFGVCNPPDAPQNGAERARVPPVLETSSRVRLTQVEDDEPSRSPAAVVTRGRCARSYA